jgi:ATP-dependent Clp endopeptidase proteolytic subunit ClpP
VKNWYSIQAKAGQTIAEISIYDEIGAWGISAKDFIGELKALRAGIIKVAINSPGGSVFDGLAIFNALRQHEAEIEVTVMGVAASAASFIAMAGDKIIMPANAFMMIHNPLTFAYGNSEELREMADVLDKIGQSIIAIYVKRTGQTEEEIQTLLAAETWLNADEALAKGFCDEVQAEMKVAAHFDLDRLPENIRAACVQTTVTTTTWTGDEAKETETETVETPTAALSERITAQAALAGITAHADALILDAAIQTDEDIANAIAEAKEIIAVCKAGKLQDQAARLIAARVPLAAVRNRINESRAALDQSVPINNRLTQTQPTAGNSASIWAKVIPQRQTKE